MYEESEDAYPEAGVQSLMVLLRIMQRTKVRIHEIAAIAHNAEIDESVFQEWWENYVLPTLNDRQLELLQNGLTRQMKKWKNLKRP